MNVILRQLSMGDRERLLAGAERLTLPQGTTLLEPGETVTSIFFIESGMASELVELADGRCVDASPMGRLGVLGVSAVMAEPESAHRGMMQISGEAWQVPLDSALELFEQSRTFRELMCILGHARFVQATQSAACNALHSTGQRLGRWLICSRFHTQSESFSITQQIVSEMLGANRSSVNLVLGAFERAGLVRVVRGQVHIRDAEGLERIACECFRPAIHSFHRLLDYADRERDGESRMRRSGEDRKGQW